MPRRNIAATSGLTEAVLRDLYEVQLRTDSEIGQRFGMSGEGIGYFRKRFGIATISPRQRRDRLTGRTGPSLDELSPARLADLYSQLSAGGLAKMYGVSKPAIRAYLRKYGIQTISKTERCTVTSEFSDAQKETCLGVFLGDGHIIERGVLKVGHSYKQLGYLRHLHQVLSPYSRDIEYEEKIMPKSGNTTYGFSFRTVQHSWFRAMQQVFYPEGPRIFPDDVLSELSPRSLAYWYFDDGHLDESGMASFALGDIPLENANHVAEAITRRFSLDTFISSATPRCQKLMIRARSTDAFFLLIREFLLPDLAYKIPVKHWPKGVVPFTPKNTEQAIALPKELVEQSLAWAVLDADAKDELVLSLTRFWRSMGFPYHTPKPEELFVLSNLAERQVLLNGSVRALQVGQGVCQAFTSNIWKGKSYGASHSPYDIFHDDALLSRVLRFSLESGHVPSASKLRLALRLWRRTGVYNFRPSAAKALVDRYCRTGGIVLDPCAGYGGRLLGAVLSACRASKYVGYEPSSESLRGLHELTTWVNSYIPGVSDRVELHGVPAEEQEFPSDIDMVFTSPPYWKREIYSEDDTQSGNRYSTYALWLDLFWHEVLRKSVKALKYGGWLVLNVDDFELGGTKYPLVEDTIRLVRELGLGNPERLLYEMPGGGTVEGNSEMVLAWCKGPSVVQSEAPVNSPGPSSCRACGAVLPLDHLKGGVCFTCLSSGPGKPILKCKECSKRFVANRKTAEFCSEACGARYRRKLNHKEGPIIRTFTCKTCEGSFTTDAPGNFGQCPECKRRLEVKRRTKVCRYRLCNQSFLDGSSQNTMGYCCPEHGRWEKAFRLGLAQDEGYFRIPDPVKG